LSLHSILILIATVLLLPLHFVPRHLASAYAFLFLASLSQLALDGLKHTRLRLKQLNKHRAEPFRFAQGLLCYSSLVLPVCYSVLFVLSCVVLFAVCSLVTQGFPVTYSGPLALLAQGSQCYPFTYV
jgi:hypothetical protein